MGVTIITLWLIYILAILVVSIVLSMPNLKFRHQSLLAVLFAAIVAAVIVTFVPVDLDEWNIGLYNMLLVIAYILPLILLIIVASSGIHHYYHKRALMNGKEIIETDLVCDRGEDGEPENCQVEAVKIKRKRGGEKTRVVFNS